MLQKQFFRINDWSHRTFGLVAGLYFVLFGLSGSFLSFEDAFERWIYPDRIYSAAPSAAFDLTQIVVSAKKQLGLDREAFRVIVPEDPAMNAKVTFNIGEEGQPADNVTVVVDPTTQAAQGPYGKFGSIVSILVQFHHNLFLDAKTGRVWMGISAILLLIMLLSGLVIWWPGKKFLKRQLSWPNIKSWYKGSIDLHKLFGAYTLLLMILVTFSGMYISVPQWFEGSPPNKGGKQESKPSNITPAIDFAGLQAGLAAQGLLQRPLTVSYNAREKVIQVRGADPGRLFLFDSASAELKEKPKDEKAGGFQMRKLQKDIHTGGYWGVLGKSISFFAGLLPLFFYVTGCYIWWTRRSLRKV